MSEKEIRAAIDKLCTDLDLRARQAGRVVRAGVFPVVVGSVVGTGLAVASCSSEESSTPITTITTTISHGGHGGQAGSGGAAGAGGGVQPPYMAPDP